MVMPLCGTFHYAGVVPEQQASPGLSHWTCEDRSGAAVRSAHETPASWKFWRRRVHPAGGLERLRDNRLVGLQPLARISGGQLILEASSRDRAQVRLVTVELDRALLESLGAGDRIELVRTDTADIGVSLLRGGDLLWAAGAVTTVPLGPMLQAHNGPTGSFASDEWPRKDTWVEVSANGQTSRLRDGEEVTIGEYRVTLARSFKDGIPGAYENAAISRDVGGLHAAVVRAADSLRRWNAGLRLTAW